MRKQFLTNLKYLRILNGLKQWEVADLLGCSRPAYGAWEEQRACPPFETMFKIADLYNVPFEDLLKKDLSQSLKTPTIKKEIVKI